MRQIIDRMFVYSLTVVYCFGIIFSYGVMSRYWDYLGFTYHFDGEEIIYLFSFLAALPSIFLATKISKVADFSAWIIFFIVFLPCTLVPLMQYKSLDQSLPTHLTVLTASIIFILTCRIRLTAAALPRISSKTFWIYFSIIYFLLILPVIFTFQSEFNVVEFDDVYAQRSVTATVSNRFTNYAVPILSDAFNPFIIAIGLWTRNRLLIALGFASQIVLFGTFAMRSTMLSPFLVIGVWLIFNRQQELTGARLAAVLTGMIVSFLPLVATYDNEGIIGSAIGLLYMRTLLLAGATFGVYENFFSIYPNTYMSHMALGRLFIEYPYGNLQIGQVVGQYLSPSASGNSINYNAHFLATDGIAGFGLAGVIPAAAILGITLALIGGVITPSRTRLAAAAYVPFLMSLSNVSIFTSLLTGGGGVLTLLLIASNQIMQDEHAQGTLSK